MNCKKLCTLTLNISVGFSSRSLRTLLKYFWKFFSMTKPSIISIRRFLEDYSLIFSFWLFMRIFKKVLLNNCCSYSCHDSSSFTKRINFRFNFNFFLYILYFSTRKQYYEVLRYKEIKEWSKNQLRHWIFFCNIFNHLNIFCDEINFHMQWTNY